MSGPASIERFPPDNVSTTESAALALKVDKTTTVNTKPLSGNVALTLDDVPATATKATVPPSDAAKLAALPSAADTGMNVEVANDFDPSVTGLASVTINGVVVPLRIGDKAHTVNLAHSWEKTGTAATDWASTDVTVAAALATVEDLATERAAGSRGMVHLTALDWAPTETAASHDFALPTTGYDEFELRVKNAGATGAAGAAMTLVLDNGSIGEAHGYQYNTGIGGAAFDQVAQPYWTNCCYSPGGKLKGTIRIRLTGPAGESVSISAESGMYTAADNYAYCRATFTGLMWTTNVTLGSFTGSQYVGNVTTVEVWARPTPV